MPRLRRPLARRSRADLATIGCGLLVAAAGIWVGVQVATSVERVDAVWAIKTEIGDSSLIVPIEATHPSCPGWTKLGGLLVEAAETDEVVTITATFPQHVGLTCDDDGRSMSGTVRLRAPLGERRVIDGATGLDPRTTDTLALLLGEPVAEAPSSTD